MNAYEGYIENGQFHPVGLLANIAGPAAGNFNRA